MFAGENKAALDRVRELEEELKSQRENAERKAQQTKEFEGLQAARLRAIADVVEGRFCSCTEFDFVKLSVNPIPTSTRRSWHGVCTRASGR